MSLGTEVRRRRKAQRVTLEQLAERSGLTPHYLSTVETGKRDPSVSTLCALARGLGVPPGALLGDAYETSARGQAVARLFDAAPQDVQEGVFLVLRSYAKG